MTDLFDLAGDSADAAAAATGPRRNIVVGMASWTDPSLIKSKAFYPKGCSSSEARLRYYDGCRMPVAPAIWPVPGDAGQRRAGAGPVGASHGLVLRAHLDGVLRPQPGVDRLVRGTGLEAGLGVERAGSLLVGRSVVHQPHVPGAVEVAAGGRGWTAIALSYGQS